MKKLCVFYGNCQVIYNIKDILNNSVEFSEKYRSVSYVNHDRDQITKLSNIDIEDLKKCDVFIYQPLSISHGVFSTENIKTYLKSDCILISFPYVYNSALYSVFWEEASPRWTINTLINCGWKNIMISIINNESIGDIIKSYDDGKIDFYFDDRMKVCLDSLREKERNCTIKVADFIESNFKNKRLFIIQNHLTYFFNRWISNRILEILGMSTLLEDYITDNLIESRCVNDHYNTTHYDFEYQYSIDNNPTKSKIIDFYNFFYNKRDLYKISDLNIKVIKDDPENFTDSVKNIQLIIPMSGIGRRFIDAGYIDPKPLIEVDGYPIIKHVIDLFPGITDISFICNEKHLRDTNMREMLTSISPNCKIYEVSNENRRGPVEAVSQIFNNIDDDSEVIVSYCDYGTYWDFNKFIKENRNNNSDGAIPCYIGFHPHLLGSDNYAFCKEENKQLIQIKEKEPFTDNKMNEYASNGTYYFKTGSIVKKYFKELIDSNININGEFYVSLVYNLLVRDKLNVSIFEIENMLQWGTPYDLEVYKGWSKFFSNRSNKQPIIKNDPDVTLVLPMAGKGSRFSECGYELPKPLIDVDGLPMVIQAINCLPQSDNNVFICLEDHIKNFQLDSKLKDYYKSCEVISIDEITDGQAHTCEIGINKAKVDLDKPILISACDNGVYYNTEEYSKLVSDRDNDIIVWSFRNNQASKVNPNMYAWLKVDDNGFIQNVSCKKFIYDDPLKTHAIIGTMYFRKARYFIDGLKKNYNENIRTNGEFYVDDVLNQNIKDGLKVKVFEVDNYICWGTPDDYKTYLYWMNFFNKKIKHNE